jgi:hypothetical protein
MQLYIHRDGRQFGPYSIEHAREYLASGELLEADLAWQVGTADWAPLAQVVGAGPAAPTAPSSPVTASEPAATEQAHPRTWIPPRRGDASWSPASEPAPAAANLAVATKATVAAPRTSSTDSASGKVKQSRQKRSGSIDGFKRQQRAIGTRNMVLGGIFCIGGIAVTYFSYREAARGAGGVYFITWGAILFGKFRFVRGLVQFCRA